MRNLKIVEKTLDKLWRSAVYIGMRRDDTLYKGAYGMETQTKVNTVRDHIAQTTGTQDYHRSPLSRLVHTDGVQFVAETCGAHWLIDLIASHQHNRRVAREPFQIWRLTFEEDRWFARCWDDTPGESNRLAAQGFEFSDFPKDLLPFDLWVESGVLLLPAEH